MRVYGRTYDELGQPTWVVVQTDANGSNDMVYYLALVQCIKLNLGESPFYADWGIPAQPSVAQQIAPDFWMALMQQRFAPHFASLQLTRLTDTVPGDPPTYNINIVTHQGTVLNSTVQLPQ